MIADCLTMVSWSTSCHPTGLVFAYTLVHPLIVWFQFATPAELAPMLVGMERVHRRRRLPRALRLGRKRWNMDVLTRQKWRTKWIPRMMRRLSREVYPLSHICRREIRRLLLEITCGSEILSRIARFPLPPPLQDFLSLRERKVDIT